VTRFSITNPAWRLKGQFTQKRRLCIIYTPSCGFQMFFHWWNTNGDFFNIMVDLSHSITMGTGAFKLTEGAKRTINVSEKYLKSSQYAQYF